MIGYWFSREDGKTKYLKTPARLGHSHRFQGVLIPCKCGLHASPTPWDALQYACGPILYEVEIPNDAIPHGDPIDKYVARSRKYLRKVDLTTVCRQFAAQQALGVINLWDAPDIVKEYLQDEVTGKDRSDIRAAARDAARAAAWAAWDARGAAWAARDAARGAARAAAWAARDAAWAARDAARDAARAAAWAAWDARGAAWAAWDARAAAWAAAQRRFNSMALAELEEKGDSS